MPTAQIQIDYNHHCELHTKKSLCVADLKVGKGPHATQFADNVDNLELCIDFHIEPLRDLCVL